MDNKPTQSALWNYINRTQITKEQTADLTNFKSSPVNFKIALWNPQANGIRYLKALTHFLCTSLTPENWERIHRIKNRHVGNPFTVRYDGEEICLDYLQAVYELDFIVRNLSLDGMRVMEIGAGYGRTCHAIMSNHGVDTYSILDLPNCLDLSRKYLETVLDESSFARIRFISVEDFDAAGEFESNLCINIDSFAEMDAAIVHYYLNYIDKQSDYLYVKNPVGKYLDESLDNHFEGNEVVQMALSTGLLRDVIDIHDSQAVAAQANKFKEAYRPGDAWQCLADSWAMPWSYYWQALYRKAKES